MAAFDQDAPLAGLAGEIRSLVESDQFDLGGYTEPRAKDLVVAAFSAPLTGPTAMIKVTFVVGGGKLVRSRYSDDLTKWMLNALRDIGFSEDRSAAETFDSQSTFKQQHDTGQNLKYLIVYPRVSCGDAANRCTVSGGEAAIAAIDEKSPAYIVSASEVSTFKEIVSSKVASYKQKATLLKVLQNKAEEFKEIESKLVSGLMLSPLEQARYDANSGGDVEKITWLQSEMKTMIDNGHLSKEEKAELLQHVTENIASTVEEMAAAKTESKPKKVEKLNEKLVKLTARRATIEAVEPMQLRLKHGDKIQALYMKIFPLNILEDKSRSMGLTLADLRTLEQKPELQEQISGLEAASRGWFEDEETFERQCKYEQKQAETQYNKRVAVKKPAAKSGGSGTASKSGGGASSATTWATVGKMTSGAAKPSRPAAKKTTGSFAAAFGDDSD